MEANHQEFENNQTGSNPAEREGKFEEILDKFKDYEYIYRILPLHRLIDGIKRGVSTVTRITSWEDTWEAALFRSNWSTHVEGIATAVDTRRIMRLLYAQCWFGVEESDAMWRMYSPDKKSVKIRSTPRKLLAGFWSEKIDFPELRFYLDTVKYFQQTNLLTQIAAIPLLIDNGGIDSLFLKRSEFACESEMRLIFRCFTDEKDSPIDRRLNHPPLPFQWENAINEIVFDPRLSSNEFVKMRTKLLETFDAPGIIMQSDLYAPFTDVRVL